jgi:hypothetical protein
MGEPQLTKIQGGGPWQLKAEDVFVVFKGCFGLVSLSDQGDTVDQKGRNVVLPPSMIRMKVKKLSTSIPLLQPPHAGPLSRDSALKRC